MKNWLETQKTLDKARGEILRFTNGNMAAADKAVRLAVYSASGQVKGIDELDDLRLAQLVLRMFIEGGE